MKYSLELKWALIFLMVTILWFVFEKLMGWHGENISQHARYSILYDLVFACIFILA